MRAAQRKASPTHSFWGRLKRDLRGSNPVGYLFTLPYLIFFAVFTAYPVGFAFYLTVHNWNIVRPEKPFVGLRNYDRLISDELFWKSAR